MKILINNKEQENIKDIQVDDYFVIIDVKAKIEQLNYALFNNKQIVQCIKCVLGNYTWSESLIGNNHSHSLFNKIIASTKRIDSTIPLIVFKEQTVKELVKNYITNFVPKYSSDNGGSVKRAFIEGYNQAKSSDKKYTEEDVLKIVKFVELYQTDGSKFLFSKKGTTPTEELNKFIESLNQPKLPDVINLQVECGEIRQCICKSDNCLLSILKINDKFNTITIKEIKNSYSRKEVIELCESAWQVGFNVGYNEENSPSYVTANDWIIKNL